MHYVRANAGLRLPVADRLGRLRLPGAFRVRGARHRPLRPRRRPRLRGDHARRAHLRRRTQVRTKFSQQQQGIS